MKAFCLLLLTFLLCVGCVNKEKERANLLQNELATVAIASSAFDTLLQETYKLPFDLQILILLDLSCRDEVLTCAIQKQEQMLVGALSNASYSDRKKILYQLIIIYKKLNQRDFPNSTSKGLEICQELEDKYSLSKEVNWDVKKLRVTFLNKQERYKDGLQIMYKLLEEHRNLGEVKLIIEDLCLIANFLTRLGDNQKGLSVYKEAYQMIVDNDLNEMYILCLAPIVNLLCDLKRYNEALEFCSKTDIDTMVSLIPSAYSMLSTCYLQLQKFDSARYYLKKMMQESHSATGVVYYCRMAETYIFENKEDSATLFLRQALKNVEIAKQTNCRERNLLPLYFVNFYPIYAALLHKNGKIEQANDAFLLAEPLMKVPVNEPKRMERQIDALSYYSSFCLSTKQYRKATELLVFRDSIQRKYYEGKERLDAKNWTGRFEIQELTFDNEKKQEEINNSKRISSIIVTVSFILFGFTVITVCMYRYIRKQNKKLRENQAEMALLLNPKPVVVKKREPLTPQEQLFELASKTVKYQKLFLNSKLTLDELAEILDTNRSTLSACINQCAKCNFNKWINNYRIDYIKKRITPTSSSRELCIEAGFNSINTFNNSFKERLGCTPGEYINTCKYETLQEDTQ